MHSEVPFLNAAFGTTEVEWKSAEAHPRNLPPAYHKKFVRRFLRAVGVTHGGRTAFLKN